MIFLQILHTFRNLAIEVLPLFIIALVVSAVSAEYFPARTLDELLKNNSKRTILTSAFFGVLIPATPAYRVAMAAISRREGARFTPLLAFIGAGSGVSALLITLAVGWQVTLLRAVISFAFALLLALAVTKFIEPKLAGKAMDVEVKELFSRDFTEVPASILENDSDSVESKNVWYNFISLVRIMLPWLLLSLFLAALVHVIVPKAAFDVLLGGRFSPVKAALVGIPFYFVGGMDVPLLFVLLQKGIGLGAVVSLMLAAPVVNAPVFLMVGRWVGLRAALLFILSCWLIASVIGLGLGFVA